MNKPEASTSRKRKPAKSASEKNIEMLEKRAIIEKQKQMKPGEILKVSRHFKIHSFSWFNLIPVYFSSILKRSLILFVWRIPTVH